MALMGRWRIGAAMAAVLMVGGCASSRVTYEATSAPQAAALMTPAVGIDKAATPLRVDRILILKGKRQMMLLHGDTILAQYEVALGSDPVGDKVRQGDGRTPEGVYYIDLRNAHSAFHRSLRISYPSEADRAQAAALHVAPGGDIMIHGLPNGKGWIGRAHLADDWTDGCIAVTDREMDEIWRAVGIGTTVEIRA